MKKIKGCDYVNTSLVLYPDIKILPCDKLINFCFRYFSLCNSLEFGKTQSDLSSSDLKLHSPVHNWCYDSTSTKIAIYKSIQLLLLISSLPDIWRHFRLWLEFFIIKQYLKPVFIWAVLTYFSWQHFTIFQFLIHTISPSEQLIPFHLKSLNFFQNVWLVSGAVLKLHTFITQLLIQNT